jgi:branched-chain amino acid transport system substrate-binding protein
MAGADPHAGDAVGNARLRAERCAVDIPGQEQGNQWLQIRRERPDYVVMWGWGVMNQVAVQEAINIRFPMENFIGNWWAGADHDVEQAGADAARATVRST